MLDKIALIDEYLEELQVTELEQEKLAEPIEKVQRTIDEFEISAYSNLPIWVDELDKRICGILIGRLATRVELWVKEFSSNLDSDDV